MTRISRAAGFLDCTGLLPTGQDPAFSWVMVQGPQGVRGALGAYHPGASETDLTRGERCFAAHRPWHGGGDTTARTSPAPPIMGVPMPVKIPALAK